MSEQPGQSQPAKKRGLHKPDCKCGWCATKAANLAKKNAQSSASPSAAKPSGESSALPSPESPATPVLPVTRETKTPPIAAKIRDRERQTAAKKNETPANVAQKKTGWFSQLLSAPNTFFDR